MVQNVPVLLQTELFLPQNELILEQSDCKIGKTWTYYEYAKKEPKYHKMAKIVQNKLFYDRENRHPFQFLVYS